MSYKDILKKKANEWGCPDMMESVKDSIPKIPFSSPLLNWLTYGGIPRGRIIEFHGEEGGGKAQPLYSKVLTPEGFKLMGQIEVGDNVFDGCGNICKVTGVYPQGIKDVYEITTQGNNKIRVSSGHLNSVWWWDYDKKCRMDAVWTTEELMYELHRLKERRIRIDIPEVDWPEQDVPVDPYLLGALLGDGHMGDGGFGFSNPEVDIVEKVKSKLEKHGLTLKGYGRNFDNMSWSIAYIDPDAARKSKTANTLIESLKDLDIWNHKSIDKFIPECYLFNSKEVRLELLRGLMDTDGYVQNCKGGRELGVEFTTSSPRLSEDFAFLVRSLGIRDTIKASPGKYRDSDGIQHICNMSYSHLLKIPNELEFYSSDKHRSRFAPRQFPPMRKILSIEFVGREECQCIMVDSPLHTYISDDFMVTHNTTSAIDLAFHARQIFIQEHEEKIQQYRDYIAKGKKEYAGPLEDLIDQGPKAVLYWDLEHSFDWAWAGKLDLEKGDIEVAQPGNIGGEDICQAVEDIARTGEVGLIVLDSIPSLVTKAEWEKKYGERTVSSLAGLMTTFMRKMDYVCSQNDCTLLMINQTRDSMDNPYVIQTPGGRAIKFYCSTRMYFRKGAPLDFAGNELAQNAENPSGYKITVKLVKQKAAPFDRKVASYFLMSQTGIRPDFDYAKLAVDKYSIIQKRGAWFTMCDPFTGEVLEDADGKVVKVNGMLKVYDYLKENLDYYNKLKAYINADINGEEVDMEDAVPEDIEYTLDSGDEPEEA